MPNTASAKKRLRQSIVRRDKNRSTKTKLRNLIKKIREAVVAKDAEKSTADFGLLVKKLDRAATDRVIHPNAAARTKSRLSKAIKSIKTK